MDVGFWESSDLGLKVTFGAYGDEKVWPNLDGERSCDGGTFEYDGETFCEIPNGSTDSLNPDVYYVKLNTHSSFNIEIERQLNDPSSNEHHS